MQVWKFLIDNKKIDDTGRIAIEMPVGAKVLHVDVQQRNTPYLWVLVDPKAPMVREVFQVVPTGANVDVHDSVIHVGTFLLHGGELVFHVFWRRGEAAQEAAS